MVNVLLVDDDVELLAMLKEYLELEGFEVATAYDGETGVETALSGKFDIVVLDVMMPRLSGTVALRRIRALSNLPVLMLTAKGDDMERILGLELGADDYVAKPCMPRELVARLRAILRRTQGRSIEEATLAPIVVGKLTVHPARRVVEWEDETVLLTSTEFSLIEILAQNAGRPVGKDELSQQALGRPLTRFDRSLDVHVSSLRHKLGTLPDGRSCIQTVYRLGYQLVKE